MENRHEEVLLKVENLCQYFKSGPGQELKAVDGVSFDIRKGEVFGLVGESGCGKTTTGRSIIRLYDITSGNVWFKGQRICAGTRSYRDAAKAAAAEYKKKVREIKEEAKAAGADPAAGEYAARIKEAEESYRAVLAEQTENIRAARRDQKNCNKMYAEEEKRKVREKYEPLIAAETDEQKRAALEKEFRRELRLAGKDRIMNKMQMIFQDPIASLNPRMTVREIIAEGLIIRGVRDKKYIDEQVYKMLDLVGLVPEHAGRYPHEFSGGQRQRIGIARALALGPKFVLCDEPVSALDVSIQSQVINLLMDLQQQTGVTYAFISHNLNVVYHIADRIAVMYLGHIVELAGREELYRHTAHPYTQALLSAIPQIAFDANSSLQSTLSGDLPSPIDPPPGCVFHTRCPYACEQCRKQAPALADIGGGHYAACHFPGRFSPAHPA